MQIAFHIGANCTDEDRLLKSILRNAETLLQQGIAVPGPGKYRSLIREAIQSLDGARPAPDTRDILIDAIVEEDDIKRLVLSNDNFIAIPKRIFDQGQFYPQVDMKIRGLHHLFPNDQILLFLGMRNPVSFLQETWRRADAGAVLDYLGPLSPLDMQWSDVIRRIKRAAPNTPLYVWCNEDTPLIWEELIRLQSGIASSSPVIGRFDVLSGIVSDAGMQVIDASTTRRPDLGGDDLRDMIVEVLQEHALPDQIEDTIDLPGIDPAIITAMSEGYDDDLAIIAEMEGVELILPFD